MMLTDFLSSIVFLLKFLTEQEERRYKTHHLLNLNVLSLFHTYKVKVSLPFRTTIGLYSTF